MCGIAGSIGIANWNSSEVLSKIAHRGPDSDGVFTEDNVMLAHTRLSIVDLSEAGAQPMTSDDGNYVMVFNGEIYNHMELRKKLQQQGYHFHGHSDTETLLYGYIQYGEQVLQQLNGIFAFAVYNRQKKEVFVARDHFGVKPLYYYHKDGVFAFSSELKTFTRLPGFDRTIDVQALHSYINFLWAPGELTPFKYVRKLDQAHYIRISTAKRVAEVKPVKYYQIPYTGEYDRLSESNWIARLDEAMDKAVTSQLMSDVPVGFFLSGGLDSSLVAAIAQKHSDRPIRCYTVNSGETEIDKEGFSNDLQYARSLAKSHGFSLHEVDARVNILADFDSMIWHLDEPQADPAPLNVLNICKAARQENIKVLLGGTAGDDIFSGYRRHQALNYEGYFKVLPGPVAKLMLAATAPFNAAAPTIRRARKLLADAGKSKQERMAGYFAWLPKHVNKGLFAPAAQQMLQGYNPDQFLYDRLRDIPAEKSDLNRMLYMELHSFLPAHNLNYTDKMSMTTGVEARVPYLDRDLVELSTRIPPELKMKGSATKYILKKTAEKYLPHDIIYRPKTGFGAPVRQWITHDLDDMIQQRLAPSVLKSQGIFDEKAVWQLINNNKSGKIDASYSIWSLLAIQSWIAQFAEGKSNE